MTTPTGPATNLLTMMESATATERYQLGLLSTDADNFVAGRLRAAGGKVAVPSSGAGAFRLSNPAGSGHNVSLREFTLATSAVAEATFWFDATLAGPTAAAPFNPNRAYAAAPTIAQASYDDAAGVGGTQLSPVYLLPNSIPFTQAFPLVLAPGQAVVVQVAAAALQTLTFYCAASWAENPLP